MLASNEFPDTHPSMLAAMQAESGGSGWLEFYQRYAPAVFRVARYRGLDRHDAEDIVQQVMLSITRHIDSFEYSRDRGMFRNWVRQIAENKIIDFLRSRRPINHIGESVTEPLDQSPTLDELWTREWKLQDILFCIDECRRDIAPRTFDAFCMYVVEGFSAKETAERTKMTVDQVYVTRNQVLKRVRRLMAKLDS